MALEVILKVKEEVERLLKAGLIRPVRYVEWLSNIVLVVKKNTKIWVCINFKNINIVTSKDEYPIPMIDLLIDGAARHEMLSFMDDYSDYNQIYVTKEYVHKITFGCPSALGTYI